MPPGPKIFETRGAWENFSTPARDMRLLIAIQDVMDFPQRVITDPSRFSLSSDERPEQAKAKMLALAKEFMAANGIQYINSDGSNRKLTMADVIARSKELEVAYNPNDCVELRWGASGDELKSCKRRAPEAQQAKMQQYRSWFASRNRPPLR